MQHHCINTIIQGQQKKKKKRPKKRHFQNDASERKILSKQESVGYIISVEEIYHTAT